MLFSFVNISSVMIQYGETLSIRIYTTDQTICNSRCRGDGGI